MDETSAICNKHMSVHMNHHKEHSRQKRRGERSVVAGTASVMTKAEKKTGEQTTGNRKVQAHRLKPPVEKSRRMEEN